MVEAARDKSKVSYRQSFGLDNPPAGTTLQVSYMAGAGYDLVWPDCPDLENIVEGWFTSKGAAMKWATDHGYKTVNK